MDIAIPAISAILGIIIGALIQHALARRTEQMTRRDNLKIEAYLDYLKCLAESAHYGSSHEIRSRAAHAKTRIALVAGPAVVSAISAFEARGARVDSPESKQSVLDIVSAMRADINKTTEVNLADVTTLLFGQKQVE
jgi:hypothetical protein